MKLFFGSSLFASIFLLLLDMSMATSPASFVGKWKLLEAYDEQLEPVTLPEGAFVFELRANELDNGEVDESKLKLFVKIGNSMRSTVSILEDKGDVADDGSVRVSISGLMSTMMMPPEPIFKLETLLSNSLPKMTSMKIENGESESASNLILSGLGRFVCIKEASEE